MPSCGVSRRARPCLTGPCCRSAGSGPGPWRWWVSGKWCSARTRGSRWAASPGTSRLQLHLSYNKILEIFWNRNLFEFCLKFSLNNLQWIQFWVESLAGNGRTGIFRELNTAPPSSPNPRISTLTPLFCRRWQNVAVWFLKIKNISNSDSGQYQCQVGMWDEILTPDTSTSYLHLYSL